MTRFGPTFIEAREAQHLTIDDVTRELKIKRQFIEAIEEEDFSAFPTLPMARGFVRNYAAYLGLNATEMLAQFEQGSYIRQMGQARRQKPVAPLALPMTASPPLINADTVVTFLLIAALLGSILYFGYTQYIQPSTSTVVAQNPIDLQPITGESAAILLPTPTIQVTDTPTPTPTPEYYTGVTIELVISDRTWAQIIVDDVKVFDGFLEVGEERRWDGLNRVAIRVGNAGGVEFSINGENKGLMGEPGQVIDQLWEKVEASDTGDAVEATVTPNSTP